MQQIERRFSPPLSIGTEIVATEAAQIRELIKSGVYLNESDFVRDATGHGLSDIKVIKCRDIDYETAKKEILGHSKSLGESYPSEAYLDLELEFRPGNENR